MEQLGVDNEPAAGFACPNCGEDTDEHGTVAECPFCGWIDQ